jgi:hypothetical protein
MTLRDAVYGLYGAYRLAWLDKSGLSFFDRTGEGALRSFAVLFFVLPAYALIVLLRGEAAGDNLYPALALRMLSYVVGWLAYLLLCWHIARRIGREDRYAGFVVAYNWASVLQLGVYLPVEALIAGQWLPPNGIAAIAILILLASAAYQWFVTKASLEISGLMAVGFVLTDMLVTKVVSDLATLPMAPAA